jgi:chromate reductase
MKIGVMIGSLREQSFNRAVALAMADEIRRIADDTEIVMLDYANLPLFNEDVEAASFPDEAADLKKLVESCDGIYIVTPEYNRGIPGGLKNALDWTSRPHGSNSWSQKPVAVASVTPGIIGAAFAQDDVKRVMGFLNTKMMEQPEFYLSGAWQLIKDGQIDAEEMKHITTWAQSFVDFVNANK